MLNIRQKTIILVSFFLALAFFFIAHRIFFSEEKDLSGDSGNKKEEAEDTANDFSFADVGPVENAETQAPEEVAPQGNGRAFFVSLGGNDSGNGLSSETAFGSIQKAIDSAEPGDVINLADGEYFQDVISKRNGTKELPIVISGSKKAIVKGTGKSARVIEISHDYLTLTGFTVDGLSGSADKVENFRDKLIYIQGKEAKMGVTGLKIQKMTIQNAAGECVRLRYFAQKNEISNNTITRCGARDFLFSGDGKNGEGIYIGTAPEQLDDGKNPTDGRDHSNGNWIHHNFIDTRGNECVDIKEGSSENMVENNKCTGQKDKESGGLDSRGSDNIFRNNEVFGNAGAGIRLGGDEKTDGVNNIIANNFIHDNKSGGIKIQRNPQKQICGNKFSENGKDNLVGEYGEDSKNSKTCSK